MASIGYILAGTVLGWVGIVKSSEGVSRVILPQAFPLMVLSSIKRFSPDAILSPFLFGDLPYRIQQHFESSMRNFPDQLDLRGVSLFQRTVLEVTRSVPCGETRSYSWLAQQIGKPKATRSVGQALAGNPVPILIPCHRIVGSVNSLGGYSGGLKLKENLLKIEALARGRLD